MKKSLIALAALATVATAAQAQSSVTVYGILDSGIGYQKGVDTSNNDKTVLYSGGLSTSRWGFKGTEDLGGGLKALFQLEGGLNVATGTQYDSTRMFDRAANVSLEGSFGTVKLGRQNAIGYDYIAEYDAMGAGNIGGITTVNSAGAAANNVYDTRISSRYDSAVRYSSPRVGGAQVEGQWAIGGVAGSTDFGASYMGGVNFHSGNFKAAFSYQQTNAGATATNGVAAGSKLKENYNINASYNFGVLTAYAQHIETKGLGTGGGKYVVDAGGISAPLTPAITLRAFVAKVDNKVLGLTPYQYAGSIAYAFSKRTTAYVAASTAAQDGDSALYSTGNAATGNYSAGVAGKDNTFYGAGIRHVF